MGAWGPAIFSDDFACDIRDDYLKHLIKGKTNAEATSAIIETMMPDIDDEDYPVFWIALAVAQWQKGRLLSYVKDAALKMIDNGADLQRWECMDNVTYKKRVDVLAKTKNQLLSPMPKAKGLTTPSWMLSDPWKKGDLLSYKIMREDIPYPEYLGKYILLRVTGLTYYEINDIYMATYAVHDCCGASLNYPNEVNKLGYIKLDAKGADKPRDRYISHTYINLEKKHIRKHDIRVLDNCPNFDPSIIELLTNGILNKSLKSDARFDLDIVKSLKHSNILPQ